MALYLLPCYVGSDEYMHNLHQSYRIIVEENLLKNSNLQGTNPLTQKLGDICCFWQ